MWPVKDKLTPKEVDQGLSYVLKKSISLQIMGSLSAGVFLTALALELGANNLQIGLLAAIPPLAQLAQIPSIFLVDRLRVRREISFYSTALSRLAMLVIVFAPLVFAPQRTIAVILLALFVKNILVAVNNCAWQSWMKDLVPREGLGAFHSKRYSRTTAAAIVTSLAAAFFIDAWKTNLPGHSVQGYCVLFGLGLSFGLLTLYYTYKIPEPKYLFVKTKITERLLLPVRDANFRRLLAFLASWNFAVNLASPFFTVYLLKKLNLPLKYVIGLSVLSQMVSILFYKAWGTVSDRYSNKSVLNVSGPLFILCLMGWTFITFPDDQTHFLSIPLLILLHALMGISTAGTNLSSGNIAIKLAPSEHATSYLTVTTIANSLAASVAPVVGGYLADFFSVRRLSLSFSWQTPYDEKVLHVLKFQHWDFFFLIAFFIGIYSIFTLSKVKEAGEAGDKVIIKELMTQVAEGLRSFTTAGGLREIYELRLDVFRRKPPNKPLE